jgi:hypothetical protein
VNMTATITRSELLHPSSSPAPTTRASAAVEQFQLTELSHRRRAGRRRDRGQGLRPLQALRRRRPLLLRRRVDSTCYGCWRLLPRQAHHRGRHRPPLRATARRPLRSVPGRGREGRQGAGRRPGRLGRRQPRRSPRRWWSTASPGVRTSTAPSSSHEDDADFSFVPADRFLTSLADQAAYRALSPKQTEAARVAFERLAERTATRHRPRTPRPSRQGTGARVGKFARTRQGHGRLNCRFFENDFGGNWLVTMLDRHGPDPEDVDVRRLHRRPPSRPRRPAPRSPSRRPSSRTTPTATCPRPRSPASPPPSPPSPTPERIDHGQQVHRPDTGRSRTGPSNRTRPLSKFDRVSGTRP